MSAREQTEKNHPDSGVGHESARALPAFAGPNLAAAGMTHPGQVRPLNEDAYKIATEAETGHLWESRGRLLIVADGMGGHAAGEVASRLALDTLYRQYYDEDDVPLPPAIRLERAVSEANLSVYEQAVTVDAQSGMGTTLVAAVVHRERVLIANVGDSRAYLIRDGQATQITHDHSWVAEQVKLGTITEEQAQTHAYRNLVTRCLGHRPGMQVDIFEHRLRAGDTLLLCSDGLSNQVLDQELAAVLSEQAPEPAVQTLIDLANERGGPDNITVVAARVLALPDGSAGGPSDTARPEILASKTTQPVRLDREQIEAAALTEADRARPRVPQRRRRTGIRPRPAGQAPHARLSPRRRATLLLTLIALVALLATVTLIALRADKIERWLGRPTPASQLQPWVTPQSLESAPGVVLARFPHSLGTYAASP